MLNSAVLISCPDQDVVAPTLLPFTDTLSVSQRYPHITVAIGLPVVSSAKTTPALVRPHAKTR